MAKKKTWIWVTAISAGALALGLWGAGAAVSARFGAASNGYETATVSADIIETTVVGTGTGSSAIMNTRQGLRP